MTTTQPSPNLCHSETCSQPGSDFVRIAISTPSGSMVIEVLLCEMCIATLEMQPNGQYLFLRRPPLL